MPRSFSYGARSTFGNNQRIYSSLIESFDGPVWGGSLGNPPTCSKPGTNGIWKSTLNGRKCTRKVLRSVQNEDVRRPITTSALPDTERFPLPRILLPRETDKYDTESTESTDTDSNSEETRYSLPPESYTSSLEQNATIIAHDSTELTVLDSSNTGYSMRVVRLLMSLSALLFAALIHIIYRFCFQRSTPPVGLQVVPDFPSLHSGQTHDTHKDRASPAPEIIPSSPYEEDVEDEVAVEISLFGNYSGPQFLYNQVTRQPSAVDHPFTIASLLDNMNSENHRDDIDHSFLFPVIPNSSNWSNDRGNLVFPDFDPRLGRCLAQSAHPTWRHYRPRLKGTSMDEIFILPRPKDVIELDRNALPVRFGDQNNHFDNRARIFPPCPDENEFYLPSVR